MMILRGNFCKVHFSGDSQLKLLVVCRYRKLCSGLEDLGSSVRSCAMDLIFRLSRKHPDYEVSNAQAATGETMRLVDDVFCKICDRVNDWEIDIRAQAATILGTCVSGIS